MIRVRVSDASGTQEFCQALRGAGCVFSTVDEGELTVVHPSATDEREETIELTFFLRAWQARHCAADGGLQT